MRFKSDQEKRLAFKAFVTNKLERRDLKAERRAQQGKAPKPGIVAVFKRRTARYVGARTRVAPFLKSAPIINGIRMRYANGKLVPRSKR